MIPGPVSNNARPAFDCPLSPANTHTHTRRPSDTASSPAAEFRTPHAPPCQVLCPPCTPYFIPAPDLPPCTPYFIPAPDLSLLSHPARPSTQHIAPVAIANIPPGVPPRQGVPPRTYPATHLAPGVPLRVLPDVPPHMCPATYLTPGVPFCVPPSTRQMVCPATKDRPACPRASHASSECCPCPLLAKLRPTRPSRAFLTVSRQVALCKRPACPVVSQ